ETGERVDVGDGAVHREPRGGADGGALGGDRGEEALQVVEVPVAVDLDTGAAEPAAVDDGRVVELVGADEHAVTAEGREHAEVGGEPGREEDGPLGVLPLRHGRLEIAVDGARSDDQPG